LTVKQVPLKSLLKLLLKPLGLTYRIEDNVVLITSPQATNLNTLTKTYYVGDLVPPWNGPDGKDVPTGPVSDRRKRVDMTPIIDLVESFVSPGTWNIQDGFGNEVQPKRRPLQGTDTKRPNAMVPFWGSTSLIIKGTPDVHENVANLFENLRRLRWGLDLEEEAGGTRRRITGQALEPANARAEPKLSAPSADNSKKKIDELLKALREEIQKLDSAPAGTYSIPLKR
jgi:hypothetical protein